MKFSPHILPLLLHTTNAFTQYKSRSSESTSRLHVSPKLSILPDVDVNNLNLNDVLFKPVDEMMHSIDAMTDDFVRNVMKEIAQNSVLVHVQSQILKFGPVVQGWLAQHSEVQDVLTQIQIRLNELPAPVSIFGSAVITYVVVSSALNAVSQDGEIPDKPYPLNKYDDTAAAAYFSARPLLVLSRALEVLTYSAKFGVNLAFDYLNDKFDENADERSIQLAELLTKLGPGFIKIGQSLSIRSDLLSPAYIRGLKSLQDQVPAFSTEDAKKIIESELGAKLETIFESPFPSKPIAAASLGQVYRVKLKNDGKEVAVKVQRPDIMAQIALDMYLIRELLAPVLKRTFNLNTDLIGVADTWGIGFVDELDYQEEARNAEFFTEKIKNTPLGNVVFAPEVINEYTTDKVLTSEWVVGERLDQSSQSDVTILCSIAMNTYLTMMLETGVLHADPHAGNLLRSEDGKLCILDWGMVTRLDPDLQVTLIEHMAHLTSADYAEIPRDLLLLGFIPESKANLIKDSGVVETLADIYGAWTKGGGASKINVPLVVSQLQDLTATNGNLFQIPPYFAYIAKSFSVLEGIGLSNDEDYSIINECLPYVSKRLLTDKNTRTGGALNTFIFGAEKSNKDRIIDFKRAEQLVSGFADYSTSASGALLGRDINDSKVIEEQADQILELLLADDEEELTPLQEIFLEQLAKIVSSSSRGVWSRLRQASGTLPTGRSVLGTIVDPLGLWRTSPIVAVSEMDTKTIDTTRSLIKLLQDSSGVQNVQDLTGQLSNQQIVDIMQVVSRKLWARRSSVVKTGRQLTLNLIQLTAEKLETGDREVIKKLPVQAEEPVNDGKIHIESRAVIPQSSRLDNARRLVEELQNDNEIPVALTMPNVSTKDVSSSPEIESNFVDIEESIEDDVEMIIETNTGKNIQYDRNESRFYEVTVI